MLEDTTGSVAVSCYMSVGAGIGAVALNDKMLDEQDDDEAIESSLQQPNGGESESG